MTAYPLLVHGALEWAAVLVGVRLYVRSSAAARGPLLGRRHFSVVLGCVAGAALGNKAVHWLQRVDEWPLVAASPWLVLQGQSIVGGLIGGLIGVEIAKKAAGVDESTGDGFVAPILVALAIGRVGCFLAGLDDDTYGNATTLPWGVDFGDGIARHPTQLYDIGFALVALALLVRHRAALARVPGLAFKLMLAGYLAWRLLVDGLKPVPYAYPLGLSGIQVVCLIALVAYAPLVIRSSLRLRA